MRKIRKKDWNNIKSSKFYRQESYKIYIVLTYSGTFLSRCIKTYTGEPYSHVSVSLNVKLNNMYSFGRKYYKNPFIGGFVEESINKGVYGKFKNTTCAVYSLKINEIQYNNLRNLLYKFEINRERYGYNLLGLLGVILNTPIKRKYKFFCSQFVATLLDYSGLHIFNKPASLVSPKDFRYCSKMTLIYEGRLNDYKVNYEELSDIRIGESLDKKIS